ncbi:hypothetical protein N7U49_19860 [Streptomyces sp. AD2-2]|nr:hypothetical protein N7U49_19860 [Streptomyces sp. AD2-2]
MFDKFRRTREGDNDDFFTRIISDALLVQVKNGFDPERVDELVAKAVPELIDEIAPSLAASMMNNRRSLRANKRYEKNYDRRLQKDGAEPLTYIQLPMPFVLNWARGQQVEAAKTSPKLRNAR